MPTTTKPMPVFWPEKARAELGDSRYTAATRDPRSEELLTWNVFQTLETHFDGDWLAYRLQAFGGTELTAPVRLQLWTGATADPKLIPSRGYVERIRQRGSVDEATLARFREPIEVPVRIESPSVLCLVDTMLDTVDTGTDGRDRLLEVIDAGLEHARHLSKTLAVAVVYESGTTAAKQISTRMDHLRRHLAEELPHQTGAAKVQLRDVSWQQLLRVWESELPYLEVPGSPRPFLEHVKRQGLY